MEYDSLHEAIGATRPAKKSPARCCWSLNHEETRAFGRQLSLERPKPFRSKGWIKLGVYQ